MLVVIQSRSLVTDRFHPTEPDWALPHDAYSGHVGVVALSSVGSSDTVRPRDG